MTQEPAHLDRALIGQVVREEIPRHRNIRTAAGLGYEAHLSRSKLYQVFDGAQNTTQSTFRRIEAAFGWPTDTLLYVGLRDATALADIGAPSSLIARIRKEMDKSAGQGGRVVGGQA